MQEPIADFPLMNIPRELERSSPQNAMCLHEGTNYFGSDPGNTIVFNDKAVARFAGILILSQDSVLLRVASGISIQCEGRHADMKVVYANGHSSVLDYGSIRFRIVKEKEKLAVSFLTIEER